MQAKERWIELMSGKMHAGEVGIDMQLVQRLLAGQFPHWAHLPIAPVASAGTDNALFRLGDDMVVRLPRVEWAVAQVQKEQLWLPRLAPLLPLAVPHPLGLGTPGESYPWHWSIYRWLEGETASVENLADLEKAAGDLAQFILALQRIDAKEGPSPGLHNFFRGEPLVARDGQTRAAIASLKAVIDVSAATTAWDKALDAPPWRAAPCWIHGDLQARNLLVQKGRLAAVIDFGGLGVGDPACDLMIAWTLFSGDSRRAFRAGLTIDEATWARARGWALSTALIALPYYRDSNPVMVAEARHAIREVLADPCRQTHGGH